MSEPKRIVSVSLGSSKRNASAQYDVLDQTFLIERIGTDGSMKKMAELFRSLDGKVDAFGLGGTDLYFKSGEKTFSFRDIKALVTDNVKSTPVLDGSGLKHKSVPPSPKASTFPSKLRNNSAIFFIEPSVPIRSIKNV